MDDGGTKIEGRAIVVAPSPAPPAAGASPEITRLAEEAAELAQSADAASTRRTYGSAWRSFERWCDGHGQKAAPASAGAVALYLTSQAKRLRVSSLELHRAAIIAHHHARNLPAPDSAELRAVWKAIRKKYGRPPAKKRALLLSDLKRALAGLPDSLRGLRDRAMLLLLFASALRRGELAAIWLDTPLATEQLVRLRFVGEGLEILIARSKGDQMGLGAVVAVPFGRNAATCPVRALRAWLLATAIQEGAVFRAIDAAGELAGARICDRTVARVVKAAAARAGLPAEMFGAHSTRRGMITEAVRRGADKQKVQAHARHARWETTSGYVEEAERFGRDNAASKLGL